MTARTGSRRGRFVNVHVLAVLLYVVISTGEPRRLESRNWASIKYTSRMTYITLHSDSLTSKEGTEYQLLTFTAGNCLPV